ncbi:MAG: hypothetical protein RL095_721 [Verrucomicrobiota bacterium]|jgi:hypothetical protein
MSDSRKPDYSLQRQGQGMDYWLLRLVSASKEQRLEAGLALQAMAWGLPGLTPMGSLGELEIVPDIVSQKQRFEQAVRDALASPNFPRIDFLTKLMAYRAALSGDWRQRVDAGGWFLQCQGAEISSPSGGMAHLVFFSLREEWMQIPDILEAQLEDKSLRADALKAIERIGEPARRFAPRLLSDLARLKDREDGSRASFGASNALAAIGGDDPATIEALMHFLRSPEVSQQVGAAETFEALGTKVCGREKEICTVLHSVRKHEAGFVGALASVGRHLPYIRAEILDLAKARPPVWETHSFGNQEFSSDKVMWQRGVAIAACRYFTAYPEECLPVLAEALESFEEYDPDECYEGPQGRTCSVIADFGPAAAAILPNLLRMLEQVKKGPDFPKALLYCLGAIGPAAASILPQLLAWREERGIEDYMDDIEIVPVDFSIDAIGWTIQQIRGSPRN